MKQLYSVRYSDIIEKKDWMSQI